MEKELKKLSRIEILELMLSQTDDIDNLSKLNKSTTVTLDSTSEVPNFDDEVMLKKRLDEAARKLEMKKIQEQIEATEKKLDE